MTVRAKFKVTSVEIQSHLSNTGKRSDDGSPVYEKVELRTIKMSPVYGNGDPNHENTKFWQYSPSGSLTLGTINPAAWEQFEIDGEYYVDFTPAK